MSEKEKGAILEQAANLPPLLKARAEGFMQGLTAAAADNGRSASQADQACKEPETTTKEDG